MFDLATMIRKKILSSAACGLILILSFLIPAHAAAQVKMDSLWAVWNDEAQPDTNRLKAMKEISWKGYLFSQPDSAYYYAQWMYDLAEQKGLKKYMADAVKTQGASYAVRGVNESAIERYTLSRQLFEEAGDKQGVASSVNNLGNIYSNLGDYEKAISYYSQSLVIKEEIGDTKGTASSLSNIGLVHAKKGDFPQAITHYLRALEMYEALGEDSKQEIAIALNNIGNIYKELGEKDRALDYYERSLRIEEEIGRKKGIADVLNNIGNMEAWKDHSKAMEAYERSLKLREEIGDRKGVATSWHNIGHLYKVMGNPDLALKYYHKSLDLREATGDIKGVAETLNLLGTLYNEEGRYAESMKYSLRSLELARKLGAVVETKDAARNLWMLYKRKGNTAKALEMYELYITSRDTIRSEENQREILRQEYQYAYEKKVTADSIQAAAEAMRAAEEAKVLDAQLKAEIAENDRRRQQSYFLFGSLALALLFGAIIYNRLRVSQKQRAIIESQKQEVDKAYGELSKEKEVSESLLLNILPAEVADELKEKGSANAQMVEEVTVLFTDFKDFTSISEQLSPQDLVAEINHCFSAFDHIMERHNVEKIKTIGDAYMAAGGLPTANDTHPFDVVNAALGIQSFMKKYKAERIREGKPY